MQKIEDGDMKAIGNNESFKMLFALWNDSIVMDMCAMEVPGGCLVHTTTSKKNKDGSYAISEALAFVPCCRIVADVRGGMKLVPV